MKLIVIGLDGATFNLLGPWLEDGHLPCLSGLLQKGIHGPLQSIIPPISGPAWVSFATGKDPSKHGVVSFLRNPKKRPGETDRRVISRSSFQDASFWEIVSQAGMRVGVINVPVTYPPSEVNGFLITSFLTPPSADIFYYPESLKSEIQGYQICSESTRAFFALSDPIGNLSNKKRNTLYQEILDSARIRTTTAINLIRKWNPDLFIMVYKETDELQHFFWDNEGLLFNFYRRIDEDLRTIINLADEKTHVMIVSDHGFGPSPKRAFFLNKWLRDRGYLKLKKNYSPFIYHRIYNIAKKIRRSIALFSTPFFRHKKLNVSKRLWDQIVWEETLAWGQSLNLEIQGIYINRDVVQDYEAFRQEIMVGLSELCDGKLGNIFQAIYRREDLYKGPFLNKIPDIILLQKPGYTIMDKIVSSHLFENIHPILPGCHETFRDGIFIAHGPEIKQGERVEGMNLIDIAPTILHLLHTPVPEDIDGCVLKKIFREDSDAAKRRIDYQKYKMGGHDDNEISDLDDEKIKDRLKNLGYI